MRQIVKTKYKSKPTTIDGIKFASRKESKRYIELKLLKKVGVVKDFSLQPKFEIFPGYRNREGKRIQPIHFERGRKVEEDLNLKSLEVNNGTIDMTLTGETARVFMSNLINIFKANGGENFLTITLQMGKEKYAVTIQNCNGVDSPSEKLQRMEDEIKELKRMLAQEG